MSEELTTEETSPVETAQAMVLAEMEELLIEKKKKPKKAVKVRGAKKGGGKKAKPTRIPVRRPKIPTRTPVRRGPKGMELVAPRGQKLLPPVQGASPVAKGAPQFVGVDKEAPRTVLRAMSVRVIQRNQGRERAA